MSRVKASTVTRPATSVPTTRVMLSTPVSLRKSLTLPEMPSDSSRADGPLPVRLACHQRVAHSPPSGTWCSQPGEAGKPWAKTPFIQSTMAPPLRAASIPILTSGRMTTTARTMVSTAATVLRPIPWRMSHCRSGQVAIASTTAQASAGSRYHSIHTLASTTATIRASRVIRRTSQPVAMACITFLHPPLAEEGNA